VCWRTRERYSASGCGRHVRVLAGEIGEEYLRGCVGFCITIVRPGRGISGLMWIL